MEAKAAELSKQEHKAHERAASCSCSDVQKGQEHEGNAYSLCSQHLCTAGQGA